MLITLWERQGRTGAGDDDHRAPYRLCLLTFFATFTSGGGVGGWGGVFQGVCLKGRG